MISMSAPRQHAPKIGQQSAGHAPRYGSANHNAPFGLTTFGGLQIDPTDQTHDLLANLDADAFDKMAVDNLRFVQTHLRNAVGHHLSPWVGASE